ncbi:MAG: hypothetical protein K9I71_08360 [Ignavibacteriales bacterium]|nr:hypothetical protein [Ignavibacteriales bacterium]MCF8316123.1 hypothetical protein [Ignavibacteriales bacterium]MCF8436625.1 hypothetical protein [Ignavibacteriales bacterium]
MKHLDENLIERYILDKSDSRLNEIVEAHIKECSGCRALFEEINEFYELIGEFDASRQKLLSSKQVNIIPIFSGNQIQYAENEKNILGKIRGIIREYPMRSGAGLLVAGICFSFILFNGLSKKNKEYKPDHFIENDKTSTLEIYDKDREIIDELKWKENRPIQKDNFELHKATTELADLNKDGVKEIITVIPNIQGMLNIKSGLIVYSSGKVLIKKKIGDEIKYLGWNGYNDNFESRALVIIDNMEKKEIIVGANHERSPYLFSRFDSGGNKLGEFWHYGHFASVYDLDINSDGKNEIICFGVNDDYEEAAILVLDPRKIIGKVQSKVTNKFFEIVNGDSVFLPCSDAELAYLRVEKNDLEKKLITKTTFIAEKVKNSSNQVAVYKFRSNASGFLFHFNNKLQIIDVTPTDGTKMFFNQLYFEGEIDYKLDEEYLLKLKNNVFYEINTLF